MRCQTKEGPPAKARTTLSACSFPATSGCQRASKACHCCCLMLAPRTGPPVLAASACAGHHSLDRNTSCLRAETAASRSLLAFGVPLKTALAQARPFTRALPSLNILQENELCAMRREGVLSQRTKWVSRGFATHADAHMTMQAGAATLVLPLLEPPANRPIIVSLPMKSGQCTLSLKAMVLTTAA